jgi:hypothetical protein
MDVSLRKEDTDVRLGKPDIIDMLAIFANALSWSGVTQPLKQLSFASENEAGRELYQCRHCTFSPY